MISLLCLAAFLLVIGIALMLPVLSNAQEDRKQAESEAIWRNDSAKRLDVVCVWTSGQPQG